MADSLSLQLAEEIRSLLDHPAVSSDDLDRWYKDAADLRKKLLSTYEALDDQLPEELEHYLCDADTRLKDRGYDERQTAIILAIVRDLESGRFSADPSAARLRRRADTGYH
jgi:hypothetical protein